MVEVASVAVMDVLPDVLAEGQVAAVAGPDR